VPPVMYCARYQDCPLSSSISIMLSPEPIPLRVHSVSGVDRIYWAITLKQWLSHSAVCSSDSGIAQYILGNCAPLSSWRKDWIYWNSLR
jgi:hypothetical protein